MPQRRGRGGGECSISITVYISGQQGNAAVTGANCRLVLYSTKKLIFTTLYLHIKYSTWERKVNKNRSTDTDDRSPSALEQPPHLRKPYLPATFLPFCPHASLARSYPSAHRRRLSVYVERDIVILEYVLYGGWWAVAVCLFSTPTNQRCWLLSVAAAI